MPRLSSLGVPKCISALGVPACPSVLTDTVPLPWCLPVALLPAISGCVYRRYGPPFRLPQQLLLGSTVLKMSSPYQCWLDWHLEAGRHFQPFSYDLSDLEQQVAKSVAAVLHEKVADSSSSDASPAADARGGSWLRDVAIAARGAVAERVNVLAQLDAFAWSVARYKEACNWETQQVPPEGDAVWQLLQLDPIGVFQSKGVPSEVQLQVMQHLQQNFRAALATNQALSAGGMQ